MEIGTHVQSIIEQDLRQEKANLTDDFGNAPSSYTDYFLYVLPCNYSKDIIMIERKNEGDKTSFL